MSNENRTKINQLLSAQPKGTVLLSSWLIDQGYTLGLQRRYKQSKWLESLGSGAMKRYGDELSYLGAIYALQTQAEASIHPAGKTALSLLGSAHYLEFDQRNATLIAYKGEKLPAWFKKTNWGTDIQFHTLSFLPKELGMTSVKIEGFSIKVSGTARALMEYLFLAKDKTTLIECYELMEGLNNLRPNKVQELLEACSSVKVKRLFLFMAEKAGHDWFSYIDTKKISLGTGKRGLVKNGVFISKYEITVPKELA